MVAARAHKTPRPGRMLLTVCRGATWLVGVALTALTVDGAAAQARDFPSHAIKIIVGPSPDVFSRIVAEHLKDAWGQPVVVEPRPGAGGKVAVNDVLAAPADGYTMLFATPTYTLNAAMKVATYDLAKEFAPVAQLVAYAKQNPGKLNCASAGIGTVPHLACEYLNKVAGITITHVPYRDVNSGMMATVGNVTQMFFGVATNAKPQIETGALRGLAVSTARRSLLLPDLPTMIEAGYPTFEMPGWGGFIVRAGTPPDIVAKLNAEIRRAVAQPDLQQKLIAAGMEPPPDFAPADVGKFIAEDIARWTTFVDAVGIDKLNSEAK